MRNGKTNYTQTNPSTPLNVDPGVIQEFYDKVGEFFEITPLNKAVHFLNLNFLDRAFYDYDQDEESQAAPSVTEDKSISDLNSEIKSLNKLLYDAGIFAWESSLFIELIIEVHQTHMALTAAGMTSTAAKSLSRILKPAAL